MTEISAISDVIRDWVTPQQEGRFVVVPTFALYPSNGAVQVFIDGDRNSFAVSDGGGAIEAVMQSGDFRADAKPALRSFASRFGLHVDRSGWIVASDVTREEVTSFVSIVADCSKQAAEYLIRRLRPTVGEDFRPALRAIIEERFHSGFQPEGFWPGEHKSHRFDYLIRISPERVALIDAVRPDPSSINSAIVAHMDVARVANENVRQRIVFDDRLNWRSTDLALLRIGAPTVAFTSVSSVLDRLAS
jgi:hypothetical protein